MSVDAPLQSYFNFFSNKNAFYQRRIRCLFIYCTCYKFYRRKKPPVKTAGLNSPQSPLQLCAEPLIERWLAAVCWGGELQRHSFKLHFPESTEAFRKYWPGIFLDFQNGSLFHHCAESTVSCFARHPKVLITDQTGYRGKTRLAKWYAPYSVSRIDQLLTYEEMGANCLN